MTCPLCGAAARPFHDDRERRWHYEECGTCALVFRDGLPASEAQRARYLQHENKPDEGYRRFLEPAAEAVARLVAPGAEGLDYGCGPGPVLALMLGERGYKVALHDPHFAPSPRTLERRYAFVTCTEAAEHFERPAGDFARLASLLEPGAPLVLMTRLRTEREPFEGWWYRLDPTHVVFYREETLGWLARRFGWRLERPGPHLAVFQS